MSNLHEVIYRIIQNPQLLAGNSQNPQIIGHGFKLTADETKALLTLFANEKSLQNFLSIDTIRNATQNILENVWIPPEGSDNGQFGFTTKNMV